MSVIKDEYDVIVLGGGPGGYVAAIRASQLNLKTTCIERDKLGGICLNWGCIPTKALIKNAEVYDHIKKSSEYGIKVSGIELDFESVIKRSRDVSGRVSKGVEFLFKKNKINPIYGNGKLISKNTIQVSDCSGEITHELTAKHIIIATGGRARKIPNIPFDGEKIISYRKAMTLEKLPKSLVIIGAGAIGVEFGYIYNVLGTKITLIELMDNILPIEDKEISGYLSRSFKKRGFDIFTKSAVKNIEKTSDGVNVTFENEQGSHTVSAEKALVSIGIVGNYENIGLEEIGIQTEKSFIKVDKNYKTSVDGIYAIGDIIGSPMLAHVASAEGINCVERIAGHSVSEIDYNFIPGCTYCSPQVASIGYTEDKAKEKGFSIKVGKFPFTASGKAIALGEPEGVVKLIFDANSNELIGAHLIGPEVTELLAELCLAIKNKVKGKDIIHTIHAHPTLSETIMEASANAYGEAIHC